MGATIYEQTKVAIEELWEKARLKAGDLVVVGCSTSEVVGSTIGATISATIGVAIVSPSNWNLFNPPFGRNLSKFYGSPCRVIKHYFNIVIFSCHKLNHKLTASTTGCAVGPIGKDT